MQGHRRRRATKRSPATPMRPSGSGGAWASAALALLGDATASPASRRLASAHAALGTRHILILGQAPRNSVRSDDKPLGRRAHKIEWITSHES